MAIKSYIAKSRIVHSGKTYLAGSALSLDTEDGDRLIALGAATEVDLSAVSAVAPGTAAIPIDNLTKPQLVAHAGSLGIAIDPNATAAAILAAIKAATTPAPVAPAAEAPAA